MAYQITIYYSLFGKQFENISYEVKKYDNSFIGFGKLLKLPIQEFIKYYYP